MRIKREESELTKIKKKQKNRKIWRIIEGETIVKSDGGRCLWRWRN